MSPRVTAPSPGPSLEKSRLENAHHEDAFANVASWRKGLAQSPCFAPAREVLTHLNTNASRPTSRETSRVSTSTSIPRPAPIPDVFASTEKGAITARVSFPNGKRERENPPQSTTKRAKVDKAAKTEEEAWRSKWIKSFPTLVFHFEIGAEGHGRMLENRVKSMGAVSRS